MTSPPEGADTSEWNNTLCIDSTTSTFGKILLKKMNNYYQPKTLQEAMDVTMEFEVEHQIM